MLALRDVHEGGATRVAIDGDHVLTGGADGVVALFPIKRWPQSASLWARQCHESGITYVVLHDTLSLGLSCGRDGRIILHENIHDVGDDTKKSTSRVICHVTGEVRCLYFDAARRRVFVGGDSLRCLHMTANRFNIQTIPLPIPHPLVALALSPCGRLLAVANAGGSIAVIGVVPPAAALLESGKLDSHTQNATQLSEQELVDANGLRKVKLVFHNVLSPSAKCEDACTYRMQWCETNGSALLAVPTAVEVLVYQLSSNGTSPAGYQMRCIGGLHGAQLMDFHSVGLYPLSSHRMMCVMASQKGLYIAKVSSGKLAMTHYRLQKYDSESSITDMQVNERTGDIAVGLRSGKVSLLHRAALKGLDAAKPAAPRSSSGHPAHATRPARDRATKVRARVEAATRPPTASPEEDFINDASTSEGSRADASSSAPDSVEGTEVDEEEDLEAVIADLKGTGGSDGMDVDGGVRSSRWRREDPRRVVGSVRRQPSRFLDDEAEEASSGDAEAEDEVAYEEDGYGERTRRDDADRSRNDRASDEDGEGSDVGERSSVSALGTTMGGPDADVAAPLLRHGGGVVRDYSFQVGATPAGEEGSCYLAYNSVGFICCTREAATVHFHDISYPAVRVHENGVILMGALSPVGAGFVVLPSEVGGDGAMLDSVDDAPRLVVYFRTFVSLGAQSDWRARLLPGETVRCMAAGIHFIAVATSRYLRLFSLSGLEIGVLSKFPRVVTMAGTSSRKLMGSYKVDFDPLAVVFLEGGELKMEVLNVANRSSVVPVRVVPLTESSDGTTHELQWLGWSEDGPLHTADTAGVVRMFTESWGGSWVPVYDPRSLTDSVSNLWIWGVNDEVLFAYRSSGAAGSLYPAAVPSGLPTEHVPLFLPLTRSSNEKDVATWDHLLRREIRADELKLHSSVYTPSIAWHDAWHDKKLLGLFRWALQEQLTTRALDLATLMELRDNVEVCAKEANSKGHAQLVHKLLSVYEMRMKTRSKRKCTLPLEGSAVSEKERDLLLRKLLLREKEGLQRGESGEVKQRAAERLESTGSTEAVPAEVKPTPVRPADSETPQKQSSGVISAKTLAGSPGGRTVPTAPTATSAQSPPAHPRVTFRLPTEGARPTTETQSTATTIAPTAAPTTINTNTAMRRPLLVSRPSPAPPTAKPANPFARSAAATAPSRPLAKGGAQNEREEREREREEKERRAREEKARWESAKRESEKRDREEKERRERERPNGAALPAVELLGASQPEESGVRDPFLQANDDSNSGSSGGPTVRAVLDVGHPDEAEPLPRSSLFGEALRKRYREDDNDDDDDDSVVVDGQREKLSVPVLAVPHVA